MDKFALVTGASRGIGKAIALRLAREGYNLIINSRISHEALNNVAKEIEAEGVKCLPIIADVSDYFAVEKMFKEISSFTDNLSCVVNNAGISHIGLFTQTSPQKWNELINNNINSAYNICYFAVPSMINSKKGSIINISSIWGITGASMEVAYSTTKAALNGFTKSLAKELGPSNIRVNAIACGAIDTEMNSWMTPEDIQSFEAGISLCRFGKPEEVADLVIFLASDSSSYLTGEIISLDGGSL